MCLKEVVRNEILDKVLKPLNFDPKHGRKFFILIVDSLAMKILSSCFKMDEIFAEGITVVEDLSKRREPMPIIDAIYIMAPIRQSVEDLINDFTPKSKRLRSLYRSANVFFLDPCPKDVFELLGKSVVLKYLKTLKEINLSFIPFERQIFQIEAKDDDIIDSISSGISSFCARMGVYPSLSYHSDFGQSAEICYRVEQKLDELMKYEVELGIESDAQLIIVDRSFDLLSPLMHEMTLQAMATDILDFEDGVYKFQTESGNKETLLDESDENWVEMRHEHIADVIRKVTDRVKETTKAAKTMGEGSSSMSISRMGDTLRRLPAHQKKVERISTYMKLAEECMQKYQSGLNEVCLLEQDMATGYCVDGSPIKDANIMRRLSALILPSIPTETRLRLILIYLLAFPGKSEEYFERLLELTDITESQYDGVFELFKWRKKSRFQIPQKPRSTYDESLPTSRWRPRMEDLMKDVIEAKLDETMFKYMGKRPTVVKEKEKPKSARFGSSSERKSSKLEEKRKIFFFVLGGMTYSEIRAAYNLTNTSDCAIYIGSDRILTPSRYLAHLRRLANANN